MDKAVDISIVKLTNYKAVWGYIHKNHQATIPQIARAVGLSLPTVTRAVDYGVNEGILRVAGVMGAERGRKAQVYTLCADYMHFLLILIDTQKLYFKVHNFLSITIKEGEVSVNDDNILECIDSVVNECVAADAKIAMIALALTGVLYEDRVVESWAYPSLNGFLIKEHLMEKTGKIVLLDNDMHIVSLSASSYADHFDEGITVFFAFGRKSYGVGFLINGEVVRGASGAAGELGDIPIRTTDRENIRFFAEHLQTVIALLNPNRLIIYSFDDDFSVQSVIKVVNDNLKHYVLPEFVLGRGFITDCFLGLSLFCEYELKSRLKNNLLFDSN